MNGGDDDFCEFGEPTDRGADEAVGYKRPPKDTRFRKGQSGNPRGRPKGSGTLLSEVLAELNQQVEITENGRRRKITKRRLLARQFTTGAIKGDSRLVGLLLRFLASEVVERPVKGDASASAEDRALLAEYLRLMDANSTSKERS